MKLRVTFKTPDALEYALKDAAEGTSEEDIIAMEHLTSRFVQYGEYVTIKFDTESGTATVLPK